MSKCANSKLSLSPFSLTKEDMNPSTEEFSEGMTDDLCELQRRTGLDESELTSSGRTFQELLDHADRMDRLAGAHVNVSTRRSQRRSRANFSTEWQSARRSSHSNNLSHISSSSSSMDDLDNLDNLDGLPDSSWPPLKTSRSPRYHDTQQLLHSSPKQTLRAYSNSPLRSPLSDLSFNLNGSGKSGTHVQGHSFHKHLPMSPHGSFSLKEAEQLLSPIPLANHRSPSPTPNSQRRIMKRLRASIPTSTYLLPQEEEHSIDNMLPIPALHEEQVKTPRSANRTSSSPSTKHTPQNNLYHNPFVFPEALPPLQTATLRLFHDQAIQKGAISHQYQLTRAGANLVSLQEVILPSIAHQLQSTLKQQQAKAQRQVRNGMSDYQEVVEVIQLCRKAVNKCTGHAVEIVGEAWRDREKQKEQLRQQNQKTNVQQKIEEKRQRQVEHKQQRAISRQQQYERIKEEKRKCHPRNKEMWQEVAQLMMDIQKLEKEERLWKKALMEVNSMEKQYSPLEKIVLLDYSNDAGVADDMCQTVEGTSLETVATTLVQDVTIATEHITWMLQSVSLAMEESDKLRKEAYEKYHDGHKFHGFKCADSKELFSALTMEDSFSDHY